MDERQIARTEIDDSRERLKDIAAELVHRARPTYVKEKAKEAAVKKSIEIKDRIVGSPVALGIIGGLATAFVAKAVLGRRHRNELSSQRELLVAGDTGDARPDEPGKLDAVKEAAGKLKDKAVQGVQAGWEHVPSAHEIRTKAHDVRVRATEYATKEPLVTALGAVAIGAALGFLIPLTDRERRVLGQARDQVSEKLDELTSDVTDKVQEKVDQLHDQIVGDSDRGNGATA